jgi:hypothetical protein
MKNGADRLSFQVVRGTAVKAPAWGLGAKGFEELTAAFMLKGLRQQVSTSRSCSAVVAAVSVVDISCHLSMNSGYLVA